MERTIVSTTPQWGQAIGSDAYPVLGGATVYCVEDYYHNHTGSSCAVCDGAPTKNADGAHEITNYNDLLWFAKLVNGMLPGMPAQSAATAELTVNITVDTVDTVDTVGKRWPGIGTNNDPYNGRFNGNGHTVTLMDADATTAANRRSQPTP